MDIHMRCCTTISTMKLAKDMIYSDPDINTVLIAGGYRVGDFVNLKNLRTTFAFNIGAGAAAGVGYVWGAACGKWGLCESRRDGRN